MVYEPSPITLKFLIEMKESLSELQLYEEANFFGKNKFKQIVKGVIDFARKVVKHPPNTQGQDAISYVESQSESLKKAGIINDKQVEKVQQTLEAKISKLKQSVSGKIKKILKVVAIGIITVITIGFILKKLSHSQISNESTSSVLDECLLFLEEGNPANEKFSLSKAISAGNSLLEIKGKLKDQIIRRLVDVLILAIVVLIAFVILYLLRIPFFKALLWLDFKLFVARRLKKEPNQFLLKRPNLVSQMKGDELWKEYLEALFNAVRDARLDAKEAKEIFYKYNRFFGPFTLTFANLFYGIQKLFKLDMYGGIFDPYLAVIEAIVSLAKGQKISGSDLAPETT